MPGSPGEGGVREANRGSGATDGGRIAPRCSKASVWPPSVTFTFAPTASEAHDVWRRQTVESRRGAQDMTDPGYRLLHRIVRTDLPTHDDFVSNAAEGRPPPADPDRRAVWDGLSVYSTETQARRKRRASPILGPHIAVLRVPTDGSVRIERTLGGDGHHTIWGEPGRLLALVVAVVPA